MARPMTPPARLLVTAIALVALACTGDPTAVNPGGPSLAKGGKPGGGSGPRVDSVAPSYGYQGDFLSDVKISGAGFDASAEASWERNGVPDPKITVLATRFISASELRADIAIAGDAEISLYDVAVTVTVSSVRKKGVGIESFEVTTAQVIATACATSNAAMGVNGAGQVVGRSCDQGFVWEPGAGTVSLGIGIATDLDEAGTTIVGASWSSATAASDGPALVWTRSGAVWVRGELPSDGLTARANAVASDAAGHAFIIGGQVKEPVSKRSTVNRPTLWLVSGGAWVRTQLPIPAGLPSNTSLNLLDVNAAGQAVGGRAGDAVFWEPDGGGGYLATRLPGTGQANGISADGTVIVGYAGGVAAYWRRASGTWTGPISLHASCGGASSGWANAVNAAGVIAGKGCGGAAVWKLSGGSVVELRLPGLGNQDSSQEAWDVNDAIPARASGNALKTAVYWDLPF